MPIHHRTLALAASLLICLALNAQHRDALSPRTQPSPSAQDFTILTHRMDVDVDGAPNAYGPPGSHTLDNLRDAHYRRRRHGEIVGYLTDDDHPTVPILQAPHDPFPGYYISQTAFTDPAITDPRNPRRYVDATRINYIVLGDHARKLGARLGDFVTVTSLRTHRTVFAIIGDDGNPSGNEGSLHLLQSLGYPFTNGIDDAVTHAEISIHFYPDSNPRQLFPRTQSALDAAALKQGLKLAASNQ
ncbi:MAG TPA: hypothetical protein VK814_14020 [Acidobacteriaceae bacterium]|nr:hypothetical protein [Acidobacteriaceae bacterium]